MWIDILADRERTSEEREVFLGSLAFLFLLFTALALSFATAARLDQWVAFGDRWGHITANGFFAHWLGLARHLAVISELRSSADGLVHR